MEDIKNSNDYKCVLPHQDVQKFLLDLIEQSTFKGSMVEFVSTVKQIVINAKIDTVN